MAATKVKGSGIQAEEDSKVVSFDHSEILQTEETEKKKKREMKGNAKKKNGVKRLIFLLIFVTGAGAFLFLSIRNDWGGIRSKLIETVSVLDPNYRTLSSKIEEYNKNQLALEEERSQLEAGKADLAAKKELLAQDQKALKIREANLAPIYLQGMKDEKKAEITRLSTVYSQMEPEIAADILSRLYDVSHMSIILFFMEESAAAKILTAMDYDLSAKVTAELLRE